MNDDGLFYYKYVLIYTFLSLATFFFSCYKFPQYPVMTMALKTDNIVQGKMA